MIRTMGLWMAAALGIWTVGFATEPLPQQKDAKEVKITGTMVCGACGLSETKKCSNVVQVKEGDKTVNYFLDDKGTKEDYHEGVCGGGKIENVSVTGAVS